MEVYWLWHDQLVFDGDKPESVANWGPMVSRPAHALALASST